MFRVLPLPWGQDAAQSRTALTEKIHMSTTKVITTRAKAFSKGSKMHKCSVDPSGTVRVWDSVAGHYTTCHGLSALAEARIRKLAVGE